MATSSVSVPVEAPVSHPNPNTNPPTLAPMAGTSPNGTHEHPSHPSQQSMPPSFNATTVPPPPPPSSSTPSAARSVKRPRPVKSCTECRKRKLKCDRNLPCSQCQKSQRSCKYAADQDSSALSDASDGEPADTQPGRPVKRNCLNSVHGSSTSTAHLDPLLSASSRNGDLAAASGGGGSGGGGAATAAAAAAALSPFEELASRVDRLEQLVLAKSPGNTDHVSTGLPRPPLPLSSETIRGLTVKGQDLRTRFFGQGSVRVLLNLVRFFSFLFFFFFFSIIRFFSAQGQLN